MTEAYAASRAAGLSLFDTAEAYGRGTSETPLIEKLTAIGAERGGRTPGQVALAWLSAQGAVPSPGAKTAEQARHNAGSAGWSLSPTEVAELSALGGR